MTEIKYGEIYWVKFGSTVGTEIQKTRPALVISSNWYNEASKRVVVLPLSRSIQNLYQWELPITINNINGKIMCDQIKSIDKLRLLTKITSLSNSEMLKIEKKVNLIINFSEHKNSKL